MQETQHDSEAPSSEAEASIGRGDGTGKTGEQSSNRRRPHLAGFLKTLLFTFFVALLLKTFVIEAFRIPSGSMENTLLVGDFLLVNKLAYGLRTPRYLPLTNVAIPSLAVPASANVARGDVVVFEYPGPVTSGQADGPVYYVKRCIGIPGDTVVMRSGHVSVNGREVLFPSHAKSFVFSHTFNSSEFDQSSESVIDPNNFGPIRVPRAGDVIHLTPESARHWKELIEREHHSLEYGSDGSIQIDGETASSYTVHRNYYFVLGDNRGNSLDSRFWGFVPDNYVIGEALMIYWSWNTEESANALEENLRNIRWRRIGMLVH